MSVHICQAKCTCGKATFLIENKKYMEDYIWQNANYPYRVNFRKEELFRGSDIPCNPKELGKSLHEILRRLQVNGTVERIDTSLIVKLMSLCSKI